MFNVSFDSFFLSKLLDDIFQGDVDLETARSEFETYGEYIRETANSENDFLSINHQVEKMKQYFEAQLTTDKNGFNAAASIITIINTYHKLFDPKEDLGFLKPCKDLRETSENEVWIPLILPIDRIKTLRSIIVIDSETEEYERTDQFYVYEEDDKIIRNSIDKFKNHLTEKKLNEKLKTTDMFNEHKNARKDA
jgi:hypothetical protein